MDKIAIISDIHGNLEAIKAVFQDIRERKIEKVFCIGDTIGTVSYTHLDYSKQELTLPGLEDDYIPQNQFEEKQLQMEAVANQPEIPQEPKRKRGRPVSYTHLDVYKRQIYYRFRCP